MDDTHSMPTIRLRPSGWTIALSACILALPQHRGVAQSADSAKAAPITTLSSVYTAAQATTGRQVFRGSCESCHSTSELAGSTFWNEWTGRALAELFGYIKGSMPKDNPASLSDDDYANVTAYILQLNAMPPGDRPLPSDSTALTKIKVVPPDPTRKGTRQ